MSDIADYDRKDAVPGLKGKDPTVSTPPKTNQIRGYYTELNLVMKLVSESIREIGELRSNPKRCPEGDFISRRGKAQLDGVEIRCVLKREQ
jgi:hypothetical protein